MQKLKKENFFVVVRSAGERSLSPCQQSVQKNNLEYETINVKPFWRAVIKTFKIGLERNREFTIGLDADVILNQNAANTFGQALCQKPNYWRYDFALKDRFYSHPIYGVHVYKTSRLNIALKNKPKNLI